MNLSEFVNNKELPATTRGYYFERYITMMLQHMAQKEEKLILTNWRHETGEFDAVLPQGIGSIEGPAIVEIKLGWNFKNFYVSLSNFLEKNKADINVKSVILVTSKYINNNETQRLADMFIGLGKVLYIWDLPVIEKFFATEEEYSRELIDNIESRTLTHDIQQKEESIIEYQNQEVSEFKQLGISKNDSRKGELRDFIKSGKVNLFLGAGISYEYNLPSWNSLIERLYGALISKEMKMDLNYLEERILAKELSNNYLGNPLLGAGYLDNGFEAAEYNAELHKALYVSYNPNSVGRLHEAISNAIVLSSSGRGVCTVITYNYDDNLERKISDSNSAFKFQSIFDDKTYNARNNDFPIYHVHGFLPFEYVNYTDYDIENQEFVFGENSYMRLQENPYAWANLAQVNVLRQNVSILIGLSITDPNLRRLLDLVKKQTNANQNYAFLRSQFKNNTNELRTEVYQKFVEMHHSILERDFAKLGVNVIWYDEHQDLPRLLNEIFS